MIVKKLKHIDYPFTIFILLFALFGLVMIYSASFPMSSLFYGDATYFFMKQVQWFVIGFIFLVITAIVPYEVIGKLSALLVIASVVLLILVLVPGVGVERNNSQRWIQLSTFVFQPTEAVKLFMIIYFAYIYAKKQSYIDQFKKGVLPPLIVLAIVFLLVLQQPDLGTATMILLSCGIIVACSGVRFRHLILLASIAVAGFSYFAYSSPYRLERLTSFRQAFNDPLGDGYQLVNSYIAIGSGGIWGNGLGNSVQKLGYLPEAHTDFIMAVILEEIGVVGLAIIMFSYLYIMFRGVRIAKQAPTMFAKLLAVGLTFQLIIQAVINLGAVSGLLPITGITLPFISYGGSSLVFTMITAGLLINISATNHHKVN
ncbi:putative lipid II flippase FtsW [Ornithinibacillus sp. L9]|uniref:Probable peptidoglycan glycosyltransferase FtsW n=1 Tax=Ornithinibacillus caprae TaxID=2678566 RepID=A0A6N8FL64_9BACI|nr:putative lipid II flippase FtsW [Ornithinibacillus caprae]MUK90382.1 putative lipid II flippase FtsW [Ornithinibacillus caprae]